MLFTRYLLNMLPLEQLLHTRHPPPMPHSPAITLLLRLLQATRGVAVQSVVETVSAPSAEFKLHLATHSVVRVALEFSFSQQSQHSSSQISVYLQIHSFESTTSMTPKRAQKWLALSTDFRYYP